MSNADEIEKLHRLKESGVIDEAEFQQGKARLLGGERSELSLPLPLIRFMASGVGSFFSV